MTDQEYANRNALGYEGDTYVHDELKKLVSKFKITTIFETGTYKGFTTNRLATLVPHTITIEVSNEYYNEAMKNFIPSGLGEKCIDAYLGDSPTKLNELLSVDEYDNNLFFLDAHWGDVCPLLNELEVIAEHDSKPCIVIHDFLVPGRNDLGFDKYKGQPFTFEWIKPHLDAIYGIDKYDYHYNDKADGAMRGLIYIYPKVKQRKKK